MKKSEFKYQLLLHLVVLIFGFTGILGKLITLQAHVLVTYRLAIAVLSIAIYFALIKLSIKMNWRIVLINSLIGVMVGLHWVLFFASIKHSTVAVTMVCLSTAPFFVSLFEPIFFGRPIRFYELVLGLVALLALALIFRFELEYKTGIILGVSAAIVSATFTVFNGKFMINGMDSRLLSFYQLLGGLVSVGLYSIIQTPLSTGAWSLYGLDWLYLFILGSVCTAFAYMAAMEVLKILSPFTTMLTINLEPLYAIVMALLIFGETERMSFGFYVGTLLILATIAANVLIKRRLAPELRLLPEEVEST